MFQVVRKNGLVDQTLSDITCISDRPELQLEHFTWDVRTKGQALRKRGRSRTEERSEERKVDKKKISKNVRTTMVIHSNTFQYCST
jgi:hypothetical protein